jgi:hypothetical protein
MTREEQEQPMPAHALQLLCFVPHPAVLRKKEGAARKTHFIRSYLQRPKKGGLADVTEKTSWPREGTAQPDYPPTFAQDTPLLIDSRGPVKKLRTGN